MFVRLRKQIDANQPLKEAFEHLSIQMRGLYVQDEILQRAKETPAKEGASAGDGAESRWLAESTLHHRRIWYETRAQAETSVCFKTAGGSKERYRSERRERSARFNDSFFSTLLFALFTGSSSLFNYNRDKWNEGGDKSLDKS
jgi:hypothetical protein